jgi:hypothetical protein
VSRCGRQLTLRFSAPSAVRPIRIISERGIGVALCGVCHYKIQTFSPCFTPFCFNALCHYTPLLNIRPLVFGLRPFGWLRSVTLTPSCSIISWGCQFLFTHTVTDTACCARRTTYSTHEVYRSVHSCLQ